MASTATLREVAKRAGVSLGTASQALNHRPSVSIETRARVMEAARSVGYSLKESQIIAAQQVSMVGMLVKNSYEIHETVNPFYSHVQAGVESECRRRGLSLMFSNIEVDRRNRPVTWPAMLSDPRIDGLVIIGTLIEDAVDFIQRKAGRAIVLVDAYAPMLSHDAVLIDNYQGMMNLVQHLIDSGHRRIGLLGWGPEAAFSIQERRQGYLAALRNNGISETFIEETRLEREAGYYGAQRLLEGTPCVTAIVGCNDDTAIGALYGARDLGFNVPAEISVAGFDDIDLAREVVPALTTVRVPKSWLGVMGVRFLLDRVAYPEQPRLSVRLATELIIRDSTSAFKV
jgi:LacI family transcriptional regulator